MPNYQLGKIYKIVCNTSGLVYYGSTCEPTLARRLSCHEANYVRWKNGLNQHMITSFLVFEANNYEIVLVELAPSNNKMELHRMERFYIENNECVNKNIPTGTIEEWRIKNRQKQIEFKAKYYASNREQLNEQNREYYKINKEKLANWQNKKSNITR